MDQAVFLGDEAPEGKGKGILHL